MPTIGNAIINDQLLDGILRAGVIINDHLTDIDIAAAGFDTLPGPHAIGIMTGLTTGPLCAHMIGSSAGQ